MRVISQDGKIDIPYEKFCIAVTKKNKIVAAEHQRDFFTGDSVVLLAEYDNIGDAEMALNLLHHEWISGGVECNSFQFPEIHSLTVKKRNPNKWVVVNLESDTWHTYNG